MKDNIQVSEEKLLNISLLQKLKTAKGPHYLKKFLKVSDHIKGSKQICIPNQKRTILIVLIEGKISMTIEKRKKQEVTISRMNYCLVDGTTKNTLIHEGSQFYQLSDRHLYDIFQGILSFPELYYQLNKLRQAQFFRLYEKKLLIRLALDLQQKVFSIGTIIYRQTQKVDHLYLILQGQVKVFKKGCAISILSKNEVFGKYFGKNQKAKETTKVVSEFAKVYKIKPDVLIMEDSQVYENSRNKWRQSRIMKRNYARFKTIQSDKKSHNASFLEKEKLFSSIYGMDHRQMERASRTLTQDQITSESRQEFYQKKLNKIKQIQRKKWGNLDQKIVLYEFNLDKASKKRMSEIQRKRVKTEFSKRNSVSQLY